MVIVRPVTRSLCNALIKKHLISTSHIWSLKEYLGNHISIYLFSLITFVFCFMHWKHYLGVTRQKGLWNYKGQECLLQILWEPRTTNSSLALRICASLPAPTFPCSYSTASFSYSLSFSPGNLRLPRANILPTFPHHLNLPNEGN